MATYGQGKMLGSGINPESFKQDYSGFANAAAMQAQGIASLGQSIGGAIQDYGKIKKQQQQDERDVQKSKSVAKAIGDLIPELKPTLENSLMLLDNKELPLSQRKAEADAISDILTLGIGAISNKQKLDLERSQIEAATNEAAARAEAARRTAPTIQEFGVPGGMQKFQWNPSTQSFEPPKVNMGGTGFNLPTEQPPIDHDLSMLLPPVGSSSTPAASDAAQAIDYANQLTQGKGNMPNVSLIPNITPTIPVQGGIGFTPNKPEKTETFRPATAEESAMYGGMPGQMSSTGKFIPINLPSGFSIEQTPEGGLTVVQGAGVGGKQAAQKAASEAYKMKNATALSQELNRLEDTTQDMVPGVVGSVARMAGERIPGSDLAAKKATIDRIVSTLTLQNLQDMRNSSPTGASLGSISNMDVGLLRDSATALSNAQNPEEFQRELTRLQNLQHEIIYGKESVLRDKLNKKEITQTQFDEAMASAPKRFIDERGQIQFRNTTAPSGTGVGLSPEAQNMLKELNINE